MVGGRKRVLAEAGHVTEAVVGDENFEKRMGSGDTGKMGIPAKFT